MGELLHLHNDHERAQLLLPWYVNGTLEPGEIALFEAHLAECGECRTELANERELRGLYADAPLVGEDERPAAPPSGNYPPAMPVRPMATGWGKAIQVGLAAAAVVTLIVVAAPSESEGQYRLLGSDRPSSNGNAIVLFAPDTSERALRAALEQADARLVDGPTASGAYVVHVPEQHRAAALAGLRALPQVVLAEPVDASDTP